MLTNTIDEETQADSVRDFVLRLSSAPNLSESDAIEAIKSQLKGLEQNRYFVEVFDSLDPERFYDSTRQLPDSQKQLLSRAINEYVENP